MKLKYDDSDKNSILDYSSLLVGKTFLDVIKEADIDDETREKIILDYENIKRKGALGDLLEEYYFGCKSNNRQEPDFEKVGIELKSSPYEIKKDKTLRAGERLSITMIPHNKPIETNFYKSDLWHKLELLLLIYYYRDKNVKSKLDYRIDYSYLFTPPEEDLKIILDDFNTIVDKVINGRAHELSESDTMYLGACTKGNTALSSTYPQFYGSHILSKSRNFCLKQSYMTYVLNNYIAKNTQVYEPIIKDEKSIEGKTFEEFVEKLINNHVGQTDQYLCEIFNRKYNDNKSQWIELTYKMLGIKSNNAEEFVKANIVVKAIRIEQNGSIRENMSFPVFKYKEIIKEDWEDSTLRKYFDETRFLFVIFKSDGHHYVLKGCQFWNMPYQDLEGDVKKGWHKVVNTITNGIKFEIVNQSNGKPIIKNNLLKHTENKIIHVRPHAQKSYYRFTDGLVIGNGKVSDANELPDGTLMTNHCFWINKTYVLNQIKNELKG